MNKILDNELAFEQANAKMAKFTASLGAEDFPADFALSLYCECANKACAERVDVPVDEYTAAKAEEAFIVKPDHYLPEFERIHGKFAHYWTVVKRPEKLNKPFEV